MDFASLLQLQMYFLFVTSAMIPMIFLNPFCSSTNLNFVKTALGLGQNISATFKDAVLNANIKKEKRICVIFLLSSQELLEKMGKLSSLALLAALCVIGLAVNYADAMYKMPWVGYKGKKTKGYDCHNIFILIILVFVFILIICKPEHKTDGSSYHNKYK